MLSTSWDDLKSCNTYSKLPAENRKNNYDVLVVSSLIGPLPVLVVLDFVLVTLRKTV
jgi:hypothetical protein